ncbi:Predicted homoserine dehydrogenase, contains C-terminal SAF domain [Cyclobacterium lianum]|uniref:Predicted homoserine dehydrogenase, contains C-terminal SAF domain n=1 Tax=Cyclobacterium lianum TaxID=388280 RepID=A0A1M7PD85_9BACT|nr:NAD(P)-dependent oxidoreductase [Cyclobacterium lianum]SHN14950.1 Predicted homoserine dehydrogenase, contains C-terminal SAF domain [Cyclobacterium lianum]
MKSTNGKKLRIGIVGTGGIGRGLAKLIARRPDMVISHILTRRKGSIEDLGVSQDYLTTEPEKLFDSSDLIVVSTGDAIYSTKVIDKAFEYGLPVVTMDADTQVVTGSWLSRRGVITEANGDQPGCLAALNKEIVQMGFDPLVYGNIKGFLNKNPSLEDMLFWAQKQGYSLSSVTSFTDGTKLQIEQALIANGLGLDIVQQGLVGYETSDFEKGAFALAEIAKGENKVISDYIISRESPPGVFIAATHQEDLAAELKTYKMGDGPFYLLYKPMHLCFFEIPNSILNLVNHGEILLDNGKVPTVSVGAIAKKDLSQGSVIDKGIGGMEVRGEALRIEDSMNHVPIGLLSNAELKRNIEQGELITFDDIHIPDSLALTAWKSTITDLSPKKESVRR